MARFIKLPVNRNEGKLVYGDDIVENIVSLAVEEIPNVEFVSVRNSFYGDCIKVAFEKDGVHVDVVVKIHYSQSVSDMAFKIQEAIRHNVEAMTEFHVASVNVNIQGVSFEDKTEEKAPVVEGQKEGSLWEV